jgi:hypothetical protein
MVRQIGRLQGVGKLTRFDSYWRLIYNACGHTQEFAREGLDDLDAVAVFVRRHYADCLSCTRGREAAERYRPGATRRRSTARDSLRTDRE